MAKVQFEMAPTPPWTIAARINADDMIGVTVVHSSELEAHGDEVTPTDKCYVLTASLEDWHQCIAAAVLLLHQHTGADVDAADCVVHVGDEIVEGPHGGDEWAIFIDSVYLGVCSTIIVAAELEDDENMNSHRDFN